MAAESAPVSSQLITSADHSDQDSSSSRLLSQFEPQCLVCRRHFSLEAEVDDGFEAMCICRECKDMVLADNQSNTTIRDAQHRRRLRRSRSRVGNFDLEDSFSRRFSQLIYLANQNNGALTESSTPAAVRQSRHYYTTQSRSQRQLRALSDNDSDGFDRFDSIFSESDSFISFGGNGGESDNSVDRHSILDRENIQLDNGIYEYTDSDIDPMHAGVGEWNSDDQYDEDGDWEEADYDEGRAFVETHQHFLDSTVSPGGISRGDDGYGVWVQSVNDSPDVRYSDLFDDFDASRRRRGYVGNPGDYVDSRGFEELLEQLAEADNPRRGAPPASVSCVKNLPSIAISREHEKNGILICAVCKDPLVIGVEVTQLPCVHLYHPSCILPWLKARNSCPVCRYELPTDDPEYEFAKSNSLSETQRNETQRLGLSEEMYVTDTETDEAQDASHAGIEEGNLRDSDSIENIPNAGGNRGRWLFLAAAPIVSVVGIVLVLCFRKPLTEQRIQGNTREQLLSTSRSTTRSSDGNRRWWSIF